MSPISHELRSSLSDLEKQIRSAEAELLKMPASRALGCEVEVTNLIESLDGDHNSYYLRIAPLSDETGRKEEGLALLTYDDGGDLISSRWVNDLPITTRIATAKCIAELFDLARAQEGELATAAREAASDIEQKLAEIRAK